MEMEIDSNTNTRLRGATGAAGSESNTAQPRLRGSDAAQAQNVQPRAQAGGGSSFVTGDPGPNSEKIQTTTFVDQNIGEQVDMGKQDNWIAKVDGTPDIQLGQYLSRPTLIAQFDWTSAQTPGTPISTIDPWTLFMTDTSINRKLCNFAYLRANLKLKIVVNASPFYYGMARVFYEPLMSTGFTRYNTSWPSDLTSTTTSQIPGVYIQPQASAGAELSLPFLWNKNWLNITSAAEVSEMGRLRTIPFYPLKSANGVATPVVRINIFAWLENVELMGPTLVLPLQAKEEWASGPISRPATVVAAIASALANVPVIGQFARATEMIATAGARAAALFGYTKVPNVENVSALVPRPNPQLSNAETGIPSEKLTLDPKQEVSIDPTLHGLPNCDELAIPYVVQKESFVTVQEWDMLNAQDATILQARVTPIHYSSHTVPTVTPTNTVYAFTPMAYLANMFQYWRGDIIFRVKIVCTKFHKGRLRVTYDPVGNLGTNTNTYNTSFTQIIDIGQENNVEFKVPYHQAKGWLECGPWNNKNWTTSGTFPSNSYSNGVISIRVLNPLTGPTSTGSVGVMLFVRGGESFEFAVPVPLETVDTTGTEMLSFNALQADDEVDITPTQVVVGDPHQVQHPDRYGLNFGEQFISLRKVLRRYAWCEDLAVPSQTVTTEKMYQAGWVLPLTSPNPGYANDAIHTYGAAGTSKINFVPMTHISYIRNMYIGWRGSIDNIFQIDDAGLGELAYLTIERYNKFVGATDYYTRVGTIFGYNYTVGGANNLTSKKAERTLSYTFHKLGGASLTDAHVNPGTSVQFPYYNDYNFSINTLVDNTIGPSSNNGDAGNKYIVMARLTPTQAANALNITISRWVAAGPDFSCYFFMAAPQIYRFDAPTTF